MLAIFGLFWVQIRVIENEGFDRTFELSNIQRSFSSVKADFSQNRFANPLPI